MTAQTDEEQAQQAEVDPKGWFSRGFRSLGTTLLGHDIFVSYARADGRSYARELHARLEDANLWTFVDYESIPAGDELERALDRGLRRSRLLVAICSEGAVASPWVAREVEAFPSNRRPLVPISIDGEFAKTPWKVKAKNPVWIDETRAALKAGLPSPGVVEEILKQVSHTRRRVRALQIACGVLFLLGIAGATAFWNWRQFVEQQETTLAQRLVALAVGDVQTHPANLATPTLVLLESARRRPTAEAADALVNVLRLVRPAVASLRAGRIVQRIQLDPSGTAVMVTGRTELPANSSFLAVATLDGLTQRWHREVTDQIEDAHFSPNGENCVVAVRGAGLLVFDAASGNDHARPTQDPDISRIAFSRDGRWAATGTFKGQVTLWRADDWTPVGVATAGRNVLALAFDPSGSRLLASGGKNLDGGGTLFVWELGQGALEQPKEIPLSDGVVRLVFSGDGRLLGGVGAGEPPRATVFLADSLVVQAQLSHGSVINDLVFDRAGRMAATASGDRTARLWRVSDGKEMGLFNHRDNVTSVAFHPDGERVITGSWDGTARIWGIPPTSGTSETFNADREETRLGHDGWVSSFVLDAPRSRVVTTSHDGFVRAWSLTPEATFRFSRTEAVSALAASPDGSSVAIAGMSYAPGLWPLSGDPKVTRLAAHENDLFDVAFSSDGRWLATAGSDGVVHVYSGSDRGGVIEIKVSAPRLAFAGDLLATTGGKRLALWDPTSGASLAGVDRPTALRRLAGSTSGRLAAGDGEGRITLFDVQDRQIVERHTLRLSGPINAIAFSRTDGKLAGVGADGVVHIWSISDYRIEHTLQTGEEVSAVSFDSTSGFLVVGSQSGSVSVWSLDTGQPIARFTHGTAVRGVAFSVAGPPLLFYGGAGGFVFQPWRLSDLVDHACRQLSRSELSDTEWTRFVGSGTKVSSCPKSRSESAP